MDRRPFLYDTARLAGAALLCLAVFGSTPLAAQNFEDSGQSLGDGHTEAVATGDLDGDGDTDIVLGNGTAFDSDIDTPNTVWLNDGTGSFTQTGQSVGTAHTQDLALMDIDGDGDLDLIAVNGTPSEEAGGAPNKVWLNDGTGTFTDSGQELGNFDTGALAVGDVDGDGDPDFVATREGFVDDTFVWFNDGDGTFSGGDQFLGGSGPIDAALADVDGDEDLDLLIGNNQGLGGSRNTLWLNDGDGTFTESDQTFEFTSTYKVAFADVDGDGDPDIVDGVRGDASGNEVWLNDGDGNFSIEQGFGDTGLTVSMVLADVDNDGDLDFIEGISTFSAGQPNRVWTNDGTGTFSNTGQSLGSGDTFGLAAADVDGDGDVDFVAGNGGATGDGAPSKVWINTGTGGNQHPVAAADSFSTPEGRTLTVDPPGVLANDSDPDGDTLTATLVSSPNEGTVALDADGAFTYTPDAGVVGTDQFAYAAIDGSGASDTTTATIRVDPDSTTRTIPLADGWALVSVPLQAGDPSFGSVLAPCSSGFFFAPGVGYQSIADGDPVPPGRGLFANCSGGTVAVTGTRVDTPTVAVEAGWNLVGPLADPVASDAVTSTPEGLVQTPFFAFDEGYQAADTLRPGQGYWVKTSQAGTLNVSNAGTAGTSVQVQTTSRPSATRARLVVTDAQGRRATLRFVRAGAAQEARFARPPRPPTGVFDVRFGNGRAAVPMGSEHGATRHTLKWQGAAAPLTLRLQGAEEGLTVRLRRPGGGSGVTLTPEAQTGTLAGRSGSATVRFGPTPQAFALRRPSPNPVRACTRIEYAVPESAPVHIAVYDVLGRRVQTLVDGVRAAGAHRVVFDASSRASGVYVVRLRTDDFTQTRRVTVAR